jgi:hypothetical protein
MMSNVSIRRQAVVVISSVWLLLCARTSQAVFFDLHNLIPSQATSYHPTMAGIGVRFGVDGATAPVVSTATTFGVDSTGPNDAPTLFDGGNGFAEAMVMLFDQDVFFESVLISQFGGDDSGRLEIKALNGNVSLTNGLNNVGLVAAKGSAHYLRWTGVNAPATGRGFSVDGFTVRLLGTVPVQSGDYNNNGVADAGDYIVWRKTLGNSITPFGGADGDGDGIIGPGDYSQWRANFGKAASSSLAASVPEARSLTLVAVSVFALFAVRRREAARSRSNCKLLCTPMAINSSPAFLIRALWIGVSA